MATTISSWNIDDEPESMVTIAREFVTVWLVHIRRSSRVIKAAW